MPATRPLAPKAQKSQAQAVWMQSWSGKSGPSGITGIRASEGHSSRLDLVFALHFAPPGAQAR